MQSWPCPLPSSSENRITHHIHEHNNKSSDCDQLGGKNICELLKKINLEALKREKGKCTMLIYYIS